jgi:pyrimidine operon attenuation protein / uracil phosphoribosyltransferase
MSLKILNHRQIEQKVQRLAIQILEDNLEEAQLIIVGVNQRGMALAKMLVERLQKLSPKPIQLTQIILNPAAPLQDGIVLGMPIEQLKDQVVIVVDDVANTGRTLFYACKPILETVPKKLEAAVLVDRTHKSFPISVNYVGLSLATTLAENIEVEMGADEMSAFLI